MKEFENSELLEQACPSIRYRLRQELLGEAISGTEMRALQQKILQEESLQNILRSRQPDGWLGQRFHGYDSLESGLRQLLEIGVENSQPVILRALDALEKNSERAARELGTVGRLLDEEGHGGVRMMQASIFARAGQEQVPLVCEQISAALETFQAAAALNSLDQIAERYKTRWVFRAGVRWPGIYHLRLLAFTQSWRSPHNQELVTHAVRKLVELSPLPYINLRHGSQLIAPAAFGMQDFATDDLSSLSPAEWMPWFQRTELLARMGVLKDIPELQQQGILLYKILETEDHPVLKKMNHAYFKRWGAYTGLKLERDWKAEARRKFDLLFRGYLIRHYSGIYNITGMMAQHEACPENHDPQEE